MNWFETSKSDFIKMCKGAKEVRFHYNPYGNDPCNPCGTVKKQATYEFYSIIDGVVTLIVWKNHRRTHDEVEEELVKKYGYWAKCALLCN
jgi:hypothetical protein